MENQLPETMANLFPVVAKWIPITKKKSILIVASFLLHRHLSFKQNPVTSSEALEETPASLRS